MSHPQDHVTNTPEDAAAFERRFGPEYDDPFYGPEHEDEEHEAWVLNHEPQEDDDEEDPDPD